MTRDDFDSLRPAIEKAIAVELRHHGLGLEDVEDLCHDVLVKVLEHLPELDPERVIGWARVVGRHLRIDRRTRRDLEWRAQVTLSVSRRGQDRERLAVEKRLEWLHRFREAIGHLPGELRQVVELKLQGLTFKAISSRLNASVGTVHDRFMQAIPQLADLLQEDF